MFWHTRIQQVSSATFNKQCRFIVHTFDNRVFGLITFISQHKIQFPNPSSCASVDRVQALIEFLVAITVQSRKVVAIGQFILGLTSWNIITMIVHATTLVDVFVIAQIIIVLSRVTWATPLSSYINEKIFLKTILNNNKSITYLGKRY